MHQTFYLDDEMNFTNCTNYIILRFLMPPTEENTGKIGQCFVFVWTGSRTHKKSFSKIPSNKLEHSEPLSK